jgi:glucoamylase
MAGEQPPGWPGIAPRWTSSAKDGVGTAANAASRVWFTVSHGIVNEVYFPTFDQANTRDFGFLISDGDAFFSEEKRDAVSETRMLDPGVPGYMMTNRCRQGRYEIEKTVLSDPDHDVLVQRVRFRALLGAVSDYHLYALLAPHINNRGSGNDGWAGDYKGIPILFAQRGSTAMALACSVPFLGMSCGFVGFSDGWQDISVNKRMTWHYPEARNGNIALTAEVDLPAADGEAVLALGFGFSPAEAALRARAALQRNFDELVSAYTSGWQEMQARFVNLDAPVGSRPNLYRVSTAVLATHRSKLLSGAMIASLSIPWGFAKGDDDLGGYHLIWPRDLVESAGALLAAGDAEAARRSLTFLMATQEQDGHWPQNMWMDGSPYWSGVQMDETAFPILLADLLHRNQELNGLEIWPMLRRAAGYIVANGPITQQDRWEEDGGYSPFTLAVEVAALLAAADFADEAVEPEAAAYLRSTADAWNSNIERWTYVSGTDLARQSGVDGYYVRIAPPAVPGAASPKDGFVPIKNRPPADSLEPSAKIVSPDALALVRFGLRSPTDPRIVNTVKVIDALLKTETATGPVWHRYDDDGYGEHEDGRPFDGTGVGRGWPLLAGERAHYELAAGNSAEARRLLSVIEAQTSPGGMMPEQIWDAPDIAELELFNGHPAGSAMPLVWAHAEHVKLLRSLQDGRVFDTPPRTVRRYAVEGITSNVVPWRFNSRCRTIFQGSVLRVELSGAATVHWTSDGWGTESDSATVDSHLGVHYADLPTERLERGSTVIFTFWRDSSRWEGINYEVAVVAATDGAGRGG